MITPQLNIDLRQLHFLLYQNIFLKFQKLYPLEMCIRDRDGTWKRYQEDGTVDSITVYEKGKQKSQTWN